MSKATLNQRQREDLAPFADMLHRMDLMVRALPDDELQNLLDACGAVTNSNCWWATFRAASIVREFALAAHAQRARSEPDTRDPGSQS